MNGYLRNAHLPSTGVRLCKMHKFRLTTKNLNLILLNQSSICSVYLIFEFVKAYLPSPQANKTGCIIRLKDIGKVTDSSPAEDINKALMEDEDLCTQSNFV